METIIATENRPYNCCAECGRRNDCACLDQLRLIDLMAPLVRQVLDHLTTDGGVLDDEVIERLALLADRNEQREREHAAQWADGNGEAERDLIDDVVGSWGYIPSFRRDVQGIAQMRQVPVERVRALVDRFLADSRPDPAAPQSAVDYEADYQAIVTAVRAREAAALSCTQLSWPAWAREVEAAVERRAA